MKRLPIRTADLDTHPLHELTNSPLGRLIGEAYTHYRSLNADEQRKTLYPLLIGVGLMLLAAAASLFIHDEEDRRHQAQVPR